MKYINDIYEYTCDILEIQLEKLKQTCDGYLSLDKLGNVYKIYYLSSPDVYERVNKKYNNGINFNIGDRDSEMDMSDITSKLEGGQSVVFMNGDTSTYFQMYNIKGDWYINRSTIECNL
jgi:hypothetical protein